MVYIDKKLLAASKDKTSIKLEDGEAFVGTYLGYGTVIDKKFGKLRYQFKFLLEDGITKHLSTAARSFLEKMAYIPINTVMEVTRDGLLTDTKYTVKIIKKPKQGPTEGEEVVPEEQEQPVEQEETIVEDDEEEVDVTKIPF